MRVRPQLLMYGPHMRPSITRRAACEGSATVTSQTEPTAAASRVRKLTLGLAAAPSSALAWRASRVRGRREGLLPRLLGELLGSAEDERAFFRACLESFSGPYIHRWRPQSPRPQ